MWPRKQLDIGATDIAFGVRAVLSGRGGGADAFRTDPRWMPACETFACLSVRTGFDLLLAAQPWPPGSEILVSAVTIPDMVRIIEQHGYVPVAIDVDFERLEPSLEEMAAAITPRTRAILVAHLFGSRMRLEPIVEIAQRTGLLLIEDCAQAFVGHDYAGHPASDVAMFSFGPIKTATALGGAVLRIRDAKLLAQMRSTAAAYPVQRQTAYLARLAKYAALTAAGRPALYGALVAGCRLLGVDYDRAIGRWSHAFPAAQLLRHIRRRPCAALLAMLQRRIDRFAGEDAARLVARTERGASLTDRLAGVAIVAGWRNPTHTYWVAPLLVANRAAVSAALREHGFDSADRSSLITVPERSPQPNGHPPAMWLHDLLYLPDSVQMPAAEFDAMCQIVASTAVAT